jgi:inner membrane protein
LEITILIEKPDDIPEVSFHVPINMILPYDYNHFKINMRWGVFVKGHTHLAVGLGIGVFASFGQPIEHIPILMVASGVASLAADLDGNNLLNKRVTKTVKLFKKVGLVLASVLMGLALGALFLKEVPFFAVDGKWFTLQYKLLLFSVGAVMLGFALRSQETLKNIMMSAIGLVLIYYAAMNGIWWLVLFASFVGGAGWFSHRGATHTIWAVAFWGMMSHFLEQDTAIEGLAIVSTLSYLSHIIGDMLTKRGVKFLHPLTGKVFRMKF